MGASNEGLRIVFLCIKEGILKPLGIKRSCEYEYTLVSGTRLMLSMDM